MNLNKKCLPMPVMRAFLLPLLKKFVERSNSQPDNNVVLVTVAVMDSRLYLILWIKPVHNITTT